MRFKKSVKICPGVKVNFSKSGISTTVGTKGASVTVGKKGTYVNYGIPGTGIYDRQKISGRTRTKGERKSNQLINQNNYNVIQGSVSVDYLDDGTIKIYDDGQEIIDKRVLTAIKRDPGFQQDFARANARRVEQYKKQTRDFTELQKKAKKVYPDVESLCKSIRCEKYQIKQFNEYLPTDERLREMAAEELGRRLFGNKKRFDEYIHNYKRNYEQRRIEFEKHEKEKKIEIDEQYRIEREKKRAYFRELAKADPTEIENRINEWLKLVHVPFEFNVQYDIQENRILLDLDLPEIEDIPSKTTRTMASGIVKVKEKTQKEIKKDYSDCVYGLAIYLASGFFNIALAYNEVVLSAYTQRRNNKGIIQDDYILSVTFDRESFSKLNYANDAKQNCMRFENICLQNGDFGFKKITPFE